MKMNNKIYSCQKTLLDTVNLKLFATSQNNESKADSCVLIPKNLVIVAFGTPLISGDAYGPYVASILREEYNASVFVYGTPEHPVNGKNMDEWLEFLRAVHKDCVILAIDASLGQRCGDIVVRKDGVCPAAVKGRKHRFGDVGLLGVVAKNEGDPLVQLMSANFDEVSSLAEKTARLVNEIL